MKYLLDPRVKSDFETLILYLSNFQPFKDAVEGVELKRDMFPTFYQTGSYENDKHIMDKFMVIRSRVQGSKWEEDY